MNIPRYNRVLALSLCTHVLRRAAYIVVIAHAEERDPSVVTFYNPWQADDARFFPMAVTYIVCRSKTRSATPDREKRRPDFSRPFAEQRYYVA